MSRVANIRIDTRRPKNGLPPDILAMARYLGTVAPAWTDEQIEQLRPLCAQIRPRDRQAEAENVAA